MRASRWLLLATALAFSAPLDARAQQATGTPQPTNPAALPQRQADYHWKDDVLLASFSYRDVLADPELMNKLSSGLWMEIAMRAYVYREGDDKPIELAVRYCKARYDIWDEVYETHVSETFKPDHDQAVANAQGVIHKCAEVTDLQIAQRRALQPGQNYFLGVVVEVNPISAAMVEQMRRWIARPTGSTGIGPSDALFGGFVQLFVRQIATSDKTLSFRTEDAPP